MTNIDLIGTVACLRRVCQGRIDGDQNLGTGSVRDGTWQPLAKPKKWTGEEELCVAKGVVVLLDELPHLARAYGMTRESSQRASREQVEAVLRRLEDEAFRAVMHLVERAPHVEGFGTRGDVLLICAELRAMMREQERMIVLVEGLNR